MKKETSLFSANSDKELVESTDVFVKHPYTEHIEQNVLSTAELLKSKISSAELQQRLGFSNVDEKFDATGDAPPTADDVEYNKMMIEEMPTQYQNIHNDIEEHDNSLNGIIAEFNELNKVEDELIK